MEKKIDEGQAVSTVGKSVIWSIYPIQQSLEKKMAKNRDVHLTLTELQKACDWALKTKMWWTMPIIEISENLLKVVKYMHKANCLITKTGDRIVLNQRRKASHHHQGYLTHFCKTLWSHEK